MSNDNGQLVSFAKRVGIVFGAVIAAGTVIQSVGGFLWGYATKPIINKIESLQAAAAEERYARQHNDSLIVAQMASLAEALQSPAGSQARDRALDVIQEAPEEVAKPVKPNYRRR